MGALMRFAHDIPNMFEDFLSNLEVQKAKLQVTYASAKQRRSFAVSTKAALFTELLQAKQALHDNNDDASQGEVRYVQTALKCAEEKLEVATKEEKDALSTLQSVCDNITEGRKAHRVLEKHFIYNNGSGMYSSCHKFFYNTCYNF